MGRGRSLVEYCDIHNLYKKLIKWRSVHKIRSPPISIIILPMIPILLTDINKRGSFKYELNFINLTSLVI